MTQRRVVLSPHAALKRRAQGEVLVLPEQAIRLGGSGAEILRLCEAPHTSAEIATILRSRYPEASGVEDEVARFIEEMTSLGGLVRVDPDDPLPGNVGHAR